MIPDCVKSVIIQESLPRFIYDTSQFIDRVMSVRTLLDDYYYPIKACPEKGILMAALNARAGLDLCSEGDVLLAEAVGCSGEKWSFTATHASSFLLQHLIKVEAVFDADSACQAKRWKVLGGKYCGLRIATADESSAYGIKFGIKASEIGNTTSELEYSGLRVTGLHIHESHAHRSLNEMAVRLVSIVTAVDRRVLQNIHYLNIGGGWPTKFDNLAIDEELIYSFTHIREALDLLGFKGRLVGEPGEWIVGPAGYWASRVSAVKPHPLFTDRRICILDTASPVPCRPSEAPFIAFGRDGEEKIALEKPLWDLFGSANTGTDMIGVGIQLGDLQPGDIVVALGQGAYVHSLIGSFNERPLPGITIV